MICALVAAGWWCCSAASANLTFMFDDVMDGYHHRGIVQNWGVLGQQGNAQNPTDVEWLGDFVKHTDAFNTQPSMPFYVRYGSEGTPFQPDPLTLSAFPNLITAIIDLDDAAPSAESEYDCPVDFRGLNHLYRLALDSIVFYGTDSLATKRLSKLELFRAVSADSILKLDSTLLAFRDTFRLSDLGRLDTIAGQMRFDMPKSTAVKLAADLTGISPQDTIAYIWKELLNMAYSKWADDDTTTVLSGSDSTRLWDVGALCPYINGPSVYLARTMLFSLDSVWLSLGNECEQPMFIEPSERRSQIDEEDTEEGKLTVQVYPNPSTGILHVGFLGEMDGIYSFYAYTLDGRNVQQAKLSETQNTVNLSGLSAGIYFVKVSSLKEDGLWRGKIILTK